MVSNRCVLYSTVGFHITQTHLKLTIKLKKLTILICLWNIAIATYYK